MSVIMEKTPRASTSAETPRAGTREKATYRLDAAGPGQIRAPDLQVDAHIAGAECALVHKEDGTALEAVFVPGKRQVGISGGGHAVWVRADSLEDGVSRFFADAEALDTG